MGNYCLKQVGEGRELYYKTNEEDQLQEEFYKAFKDNRRIVGFASLRLEHYDTYSKVVYPLGPCVSLQEFLEEPIDEEQMLVILYHIAQAMIQLEENALPLYNVIWNMNCIFVTPETLKVQFIYHMFYEQPETIPLISYIKSMMNRMQIGKIHHNVKQFLESYLMFQPKLSMRDFEVFLHNMISKLYESPEYSGSMALSCRLEEEQLVMEEARSGYGTYVTVERSDMEEGKPAMAAALIRLRNREVIPVTKSEYRIGKERCTVDYCIMGNAAISRCHALILRKEEKYYIRDLDSTNHTYVNNYKLTGKEEVELIDGTKVTLANEVFRFQLEVPINKEEAEIPF